MALEAVVFSQDPFLYSCCRDSYSFPAAWNTDEHGFHAEEEKSHVGVSINTNIEPTHVVHATWDSSNSSPEGSLVSPAPTGRRKRRRTKSAKNKEEIENQRMTHIAVERNRRRQMNDYLAVLRSLMPPSYVQRGDQASIIGGAINFVKELEQLLQSMEGRKKKSKQRAEGECSSPFAEFFTFPQYSTNANQGNRNSHELAVADIEVTMVDTHANLKILSKKRSNHLTKIVVGLQALRLTVLHLNVSTHDDMALYSASVKLEDGCELNTVDEIASAVNQLMRRIQEESPFS